MKKIGLLVILVFNVAALLIAGVVIFKYFFIGKSSEVSDAIEFTAEIKNEEENKYAKLNISSVPDEAKVFVNGYYKGKTPLEFKVVSVGKKNNYKLVLLKQGYLRWEFNTELYTGDIREFQVVLEKEDETR